MPDQGREHVRTSETPLENRPHRLEVETAGQLETPARYKSAFMVTVPSFSSTAAGSRSARRASSCPALGAEADRLVALLASAVEEGRHQLAAEARRRGGSGRRRSSAPVSPRRRSRSRARWREEPVPGGADRAGLPGHQAGVARPAPVVDVPGDRKVGIRVQPPVVGVASACRGGNGRPVARPGGSQR